MDEERIKTLQARRIDYETNPMWVKKEYVPFPYPEVLEKAGYRVENIDDYAKLEVYDIFTGEKLYLDDVKHDRIVFANSGGKYFSVCKFGRIELMLPTYEDLEIVFYKDNKTISYDIPNEICLSFHYNGVYREDNERILGTAKLRVRNEEFNVRQTPSRFYAQDTSLYAVNEQFPEKYDCPSEEMDKDTLVKMFEPIIEIAKKGMIKCNLNPWTYEFIRYCIDHHAQDFIDLRNDKECLRRLIESYKKEKELITYNYNEQIAKLDALIAEEEKKVGQDGNSK